MHCPKDPQKLRQKNQDVGASDEGGQRDHHLTEASVCSLAASASGAVSMGALRSAVIFDGQRHAAT